MSVCKKCGQQTYCAKKMCIRCRNPKHVFPTADIIKTDYRPAGVISYQCLDCGLVSEKKVRFLDAVCPCGSIHLIKTDKVYAN